MKAFLAGGGPLDGATLDVRGNDNIVVPVHGKTRDGHDYVHVYVPKGGVHKYAGTMRADIEAAERK